MSHGKSDKSKVFEKRASEISVNGKISVPQLSSAAESKSVISKLFCWNVEKPRVTSEYVDKKYSKPFNQVAPEFRVMDGLGQIKCVRKHDKQPLINRPTQVQKICHTTTKLLPNFPLTAQLRPAKCPKKEKLSVLKATEKVKFAENLPTYTSTSTLEQTETKDLFNHQNPFNLDLNALSEYQKQKHNAEEIKRRRNYQIIRRTMETKALTTEGAEKIMQETRNEKFKLPSLFKVLEIDEADGSESFAQTDAERCKVVSMMDKPRNREIIQRHYQHKEEKFRERLRRKAQNNEKLAREAEKREEESKENFVFRLADESFPASECDANEHVAMKELPLTHEKFDYPINESELLELKRRLNEKSSDAIKSEKLLSTARENANEDAGIPCGYKIGSRVYLRSFHDRISDEPRGETNYGHSGKVEAATCLTHKQWLDALANDPEIKKQPPRGKVLSTLKVEREPNDETMFLFDDPLAYERNVAIISPIREYIQQVEDRLQRRMIRTDARKSRSHSSINNHDAKRYQRMKFMGIPVPSTSHASTRVSHTNLNSIVAKISQTSKVPNRKLAKSPEDVELLVKIPEFDCANESERERSKVDKIPPFIRAQPRGTNAKDLRVDKSLPWIGDEFGVDVKIDFGNGKTFTDDDVPAQSEGKVDESSSAIKKSYKEIIASKLQDYKQLRSAPDDAENKDDCEENQIQSTGESSSTLSSDGTYFTDDSGSFIMDHDNKISKSQMIREKKFLNRSLVTTQEQPTLELQPYFVPRVDQFRAFKELCKPKDRFHTFRTRASADIRERIKIDSPAYDEELIENDDVRMVSKMATDMDEAYRSEFYHERSGTKFRFKPITEMMKLREIIRKKMDTYWMRERIVREQVQSMANKALMEESAAQAEEYQKFLEESKVKSYRQTMRTMQSVKEYYQETDRLRKLRDHLETQVEPLKMRIFNLGSDFAQLMILKNFQFMLKPTEWRMEHDKMHLTSEGKLESFRESIENRQRADLWDRDNVNVYIIKNHIENVHMDQKQAVVPAFDSGAALVSALKDLRVNSYRMLRQFHSVAHVLSDVEKEFESMDNRQIASMDRVVTRLSAKTVFMVARSKMLEETAKKLSGETLQELLSSKKFRSLKGLCDITYQEVVQRKSDASSNKTLTTIEKLADIEKKVLGLLTTFDELPRRVTKRFEDKIRSERKRKLREGEKAYRIELSLQSKIVQLKRCLAKPPKKGKRVGKLPISVLPKKPPKPKAPPPALTKVEEEYMKAFTDLGLEQGNVKFDEDVKLMIAKIQNESIPFYIDHFIDVLGIRQPQTTEVPAADIFLDETAHFRFKEVLPAVRKQVELWEKSREMIKRENIRRTPYLYP